MRWQDRFAISGGGALLPILATLLALDLPSIIDNPHQYTLGVYVGTTLRYLLLFVLGGVVAALNSDEKRPIKLVQLGIAAPALISAYANASPPRNSLGGPVPPTSITRSGLLDFVSDARATEGEYLPQGKVMLASSDIWTDILRGIQGSVPRGTDTVQPVIVPPPSPPADGLQFNVCMGNGGGPSCENSGPNTVRYTCAQYRAIGGGGAATPPALGERLCRISDPNGQQQQLPYSVVHLSSVGGGECGWTRFVVTWLKPSP